MGFEEYNLIKTTMLEVAEKNNSIEAIKSDIDEIESRKGKINAKIAKLRKDIEEKNSQFDWFDSETVEKYESEIESLEESLSRSDRNLKYFTFIYLPIMGLLAYIFIRTDSDVILGLLGIGGLAIFLLETLDDDEEELCKNKIRSKQDWLEEFFKLPQEIEKLEKSISKENEEIKESDTEIEDLEKDIEKINSEISDTMDSIKHLIPYADKI